MKKVNDTKILKSRYYAWYYTDNFDINLIPVSWYTKDLAEFILTKQFGKKYLKKLNILRGSDAIKMGLTLGKNVFWVDGKHRQVKRFYIPEEYDINRSRRRFFLKRVTKLKNNKRSGIAQVVKLYKYKVYGS